LEVKLPVALSQISRRGRTTKNNGIEPSLNQKKRELENRRQDIVEGLLL
jgi:hypothetical protein